MTKVIGAPPTIPPPVVPPNPPAEIIAGYQCYVPHIDTGEFELRGHASLLGTVELVLRSNAGVASIPVIVPADGNWSSGPVAGPLTDLSEFLDGTITAKVRLSADGDYSLWETATVSQCAGTGPTLVANLGVSEVCYTDPVTVDSHGRLSEHGVLFARHVNNGTVTPISDPSLDGVEFPAGSSNFWHEILTGADETAPYDWGTFLPLAPFLGSPAAYNAGFTGRLELRIQTPDNRTSPWIHVDQLVDIAVCSL